MKINKPARVNWEAEFRLLAKNCVDLRAQLRNLSVRNSDIPLYQQAMEHAAQSLEQVLKKNDITP